MNIRKKIAIIFIVSVAVLIFRSWGNISSFIKDIYVQNLLIISVFAEDDEEDEEDEEDDDRGAQVIDTSSNKSAPKQTRVITTYIKLSDTVSKTTITTTKYDSDGDGIFDEDDPHPAINEGYIVEDDNLDGIADEYE